MRGSRRLPIRVRLTVYYVVVFTLVFGGLSAFLIVRLRTTLQTNAQESLELSYRGIFEQVAGGTSLADVLHATEIPGEQGQPETIGQVLDERAAIVETSGQAAVATPVVGADDLARVRSSGHWHGVRRLRGRSHDDLVFVVRFVDGPQQGNYLVLAQTLAPVSVATRRLEWLLLGAAPVAVVVAGAGGWAVARAGLRPVDQLTRRAAAIDASRPHDPLPVPAADDELGRLATTLNDMLGRLERALDAERRFTADASHELRTPLAVIAAELDVALRSPRTPPEARDVLLSVQDETERLSRMVTNLLLLARAEAPGRLATKGVPTDVLELASGVARRLEATAAAQGIDLRVEGAPVMTTVDPGLLGQAIGNLVSNAITYVDTGGAVTVRVVPSGPDVLISVADTGCGIPEADLPHVFDRFYRVDRARDRGSGGSGLGLEITRRIVEAHGGTVAARSAVGVGSEFTIRLPVRVSSTVAAGSLAAE